MVNMFEPSDKLTLTHRAEVTLVTSPVSEFPGWLCFVNDVY